MKILIAVSAGIALIILFTSWSNARDIARQQSYDAYAKCVQAQYGVSPSSFYQTHGYTPDCK